MPELPSASLMSANTSPGSVLRAARTASSRVVAIAAIPLEVISALFAPCSRATDSAAASTVGLLNREYHVSFRPPLPWMSLYEVSSSSKVVVW